MLENKMGKSRETIHRLFGYFIAINRARGKNSRVGPIVVRRESREWRGKSFAGKTHGKTQFWPAEVIPFFVGSLVLVDRESRDRHDRISDENSRKTNWLEKFELKTNRKFIFQCLGIYIFSGRGNTNFLFGVSLQNWLANVGPAAYTGMPKHFLKARRY